MPYTRIIVDIYTLLGTQRLALRLAESEREFQQVQQALQSLQQQVANGTVGSGNKQRGAGEEADTAQSVEEELKTLQVVVHSLREELGAQVDAARVEKQRLESLNREQAQALQKERGDLQRARQELAERPSKEEFVAVRRQLKMVQKIAFNVQDDESEVRTILTYPFRHFFHYYTIFILFCSIYATHPILSVVYVTRRDSL